MIGTRITSWVYKKLGRRPKEDDAEAKPPDDAYMAFVATIEDRTATDDAALELASTMSDEELMQVHKPVAQLYRYDNTNNYSMMTPEREKETANLLTAARKSKNRGMLGNNKWVFSNPMQNLDYRIYESLLRDTFIGGLADAYIKFVVGEGWKPELEIINPDSDPEKNTSMLESNVEIIDRLMAIDRQISTAKKDGSSIDANFQQKMTAMISSCLLYNRGALMFHYEKPIKIGEESYSEIPTDLIFVHARDLGLIEIDPMTRRLTGVQWQDNSFEFIKTEDMIYMWNPLTSAKVHRSWHYGISMLTPLISSAHLINRMLTADFPAMTESAWAGLFFLIAKNEGSTKAAKMKEFQDFVNILKPGKPSVLIKDPEEVKVENVDLDPKIGDFQALFESQIKYCISIMGLPQVGFYDESAANRDTMAGKIQLTLQTNIEPMRKWIGDWIASQWYDRWFKLIYKDEPEVLERFRIKVSWTDLNISEWYDNMESLMRLDMRKPLKDHEFGELAHLDNYPAMIDQEAYEEMKAQEEMMMQDPMGGMGGKPSVMNPGQGPGRGGGPPKPPKSQMPGGTAGTSEQSLGKSQGSRSRSGGSGMKSFGRQRQAPI